MEGRQAFVWDDPFLLDEQLWEKQCGGSLTSGPGTLGTSAGLFTGDDENSVDQ